MIFLCPHCGNDLPHKITDGITFCGICERDVDSSRINRLMCAAWMCLKQSPDNLDRLSRAIGLTEAEKIIVESFIVTNVYGIAEFRDVLLSLGIS